jgi:23S rRNA (cytidine1920-2'-O)/16S rRNA (cytidine1409-2'-O)-methyltransferase
VARRRLDAELVRRGLVATRTEAQDAVREGLVLVGGRAAAKPSSLIDPADPLQLVRPPRRFVSRGGDKLEAALARFAIRVEGRGCLDAGASTGGFTDCLLQRGARHVVAVDVGYGQLSWSLRNDPRVTVLERTDVRDLQRSAMPYEPEVVVADLAFISLRPVIPVLAHVAMPDADHLMLVKPQFEAGRAAVPRGGVVREPAVWGAAIDAVAASCEAAGLGPLGVMASPVVGAAGNIEFFLHARGRATGRLLDVAAALAEGRRLARGEP